MCAQKLHAMSEVGKYRAVENDSADTVKLHARVRRWCIVVSFCSNIVAGMLYIFPLYASSFAPLLTQPNSQLVVIGVASQFSLAVANLPFGRMYTACTNGKFGPRGADRALACISTTLQVIPSAAITWFMYVGGFNGGDPHEANFWILFVTIVAYGCGESLAFGHGMWVNEANYEHNTKQRSTVVAAIALALGVGALFFTAVFPATFGALAKSAPSNTTSIGGMSPVVGCFAFQIAACIVLGVGRFFFAYRPHLVNHDEEFEVSAESTKGLSCCGLVRQELFWMTAVAGFCGVGVGGSFGALIGTIDADYVVADAVDTLAENLTLVFLSAQVAGLLVATIWYLYAVVQSQLLIGFVSLQLLGLILFLALDQHIEGLYAAVAFVGAGFGGVLCTLPSLVAAHFPGAKQGLFPVLFGIILMFTGFGVLIVSQCVGALTPPWQDCWDFIDVSNGTTAMVPREDSSFVDDCRFAPTALLTSLALVATVATARLRCKIAASSPDAP
eukprot:INCI10419.2.p1 GENE.INCI10419.2~~INCI10419.2.p1  ORF type:complete len:516 (-),score=72.59 INCI10419.2:250-1752(-)